MGRKNIKHSGRSSDESTPRDFKRTLVWTILLALVFSAGLIVGQRMLKQRSTPALVSVHASHATDKEATPEKTQQGEDADNPDEHLSFSFYDKLAPGKGKAAKEEPSEAQDAQGEDGQAQALPARYTLQLGSFPSLDSAQRQLRQLRDAGLEVHMISSSLPDQGKVYRVRIGKFHSIDEARQFQSELTRQRELETFVMPL